MKVENLSTNLHAQPPAAAYSEGESFHEHLRLWKIDGLSNFMDIPTATIYSNLRRAPERVPPPIVLPGGQLRWDPVEVRRWLACLQKQPSQCVQVVSAPRRRRGRPTKKEEVARRARAASWPGDACQD
jgi:predicted DNA-binding transcriptional regulator AlpA